MKTKSLILSTVATVGMALAGGCGKNDQTPPPAPPAATEAPKTAAEAVKPAAETANTAAKTATTAAGDTQAAAKPAADPAAATASTTAAATAATPTPAESAQAQGLIDKVKSLTKEEKYQDALKSVAQLKNLKLTADQQKIVDKLKAEVETLLAKKTAGSAIGDVLGGKK